MGALSSACLADPFFSVVVVLRQNFKPAANNGG
jgi:hypothetical protein